MNIRIKRINVKNLGPINSFQNDFKKINLIYGKNEQGKTFLVEFLYKSLFKNQSLSLREFSATGQVIVSGIRGLDTIFSPTSRTKLEDHWADSLTGLPKDFSKLLVVKGGDLDFDNKSRSGIDERTIKDFLSSERLLEQLTNKIKPSEASATIVNGVIVGKNMGLVKDYKQAQNIITQFDQVMAEASEFISGGRRLELSNRLEELSGQLEIQDKARNHLAYLTAKQIEIDKKKLHELPAEELNRLQISISNYKNKQTDLDVKRGELKHCQLLSKEYNWLEKAGEEYHKLIMAGATFTTKSFLVWILLTITTLISTIILILLSQPNYAIGTILLTILFGSLLIYKIIQKGKTVNQQHEINRIAETFKSKFGNDEKLDIATLDVKLSDLRVPFTKATVLEADIVILEQELSRLHDFINGRLELFTREKVLPDKWEITLRGLVEKRKIIDENIRRNENRLSSLNVSKSDYLQQPVEQKYNPTLIAELTKEYSKFEEALDDFDDHLQELKHTMCGLTGAPISSPWAELIQAVEDRRQIEIDKYKEITSSLLARIQLTSVLNDFKEVEAKRIDENLASKTIENALLATTGEYHSIQKENDELFAVGSYGRYKISDLSTGAREQVLLALRIGFVNRILEGKTMFLLLDDAFQYSDWVRRERLVRNLFSLGSAGWQIIYFTMDDHIRGLFENISSEFGLSDYQTISLQN